jgi:hypothetical protein
MYVRALAGYEKALGPDHTSTLSTVNNLGQIVSKDRVVQHPVREASMFRDCSQNG